MDSSIANSNLTGKKFMEEGEQQGRRLDLVRGELIRSLGGWLQVQAISADHQRGG
jgi:hypothetical protein